MEITVNRKKVSIETAKNRPEETTADAAVLFTAEEFSDAVMQISKKLSLNLGKHKEEFDGKLGKARILNSSEAFKSRNIILVGLGEKKGITSEVLRRAASVAAKTAKACKYKTISISLENLPLDAEKAAQPVIEGFLLGLYSFDKYKSEKEPPPEKIIICSGKDIKKYAETAVMLSEAVMFVRDLSNTPASEKPPKTFASIAAKEAKKHGIKCCVFGKTRIKKLGMNALLAVSSGSAHEPHFVVLEWNSKARKKIAIVGKGITFDSGGLDIKSADYMLGMHSDMEGAAITLATLVVAAKVKLPLHVIGVMPLTENMPSGSSYKPGDIIRAYSGKTIEVVNTDAEGRVILSDALAYAEKQFRPDAIIDLATLTGACYVALGKEAAGLLGNNSKLAGKIKKASEETGERVWELPLWEDYKELVKSDVADVRNTGKEPGAAGTITGAAFLDAFVKNTPWAHLDIAGVALYKKEKFYMPMGSTGWGVRLLYRLLSEWK